MLVVKIREALTQARRHVLSEWRENWDRKPAKLAGQPSMPRVLHCGVRSDDRCDLSSRLNLPERAVLVKVSTVVRPRLEDQDSPAIAIDRRCPSDPKATINQKERGFRKRNST